jgi:hypothetical protein
MFAIGWNQTSSSEDRCGVMLLVGRWQLVDILNLAEKGILS